ncbi:MAG: fumarylacetoacetate hydrolase family protein [Gammaproteobacteria bacterium]|nr:fumarylacetoacetate hydrolase family protein [Gammaproteobacteria bacterium]
MKLSTFIIKATDQKTVGVFQDDKYLDVVALSDGIIPNSMLDVLNGGDTVLQQVREIVSGTDGSVHAYSAEEVELCSPVRPGKIIHTSCNFDAHLNELTGWEASEWKEHGWDQFHFEHPTGFLEAPSCVAGSGVGVAIPRFTEQLDYEIEVGIVIGKTAKNISVEDAMGCVVGLMIFNDVSARDIQAREHANNVILMGKSFDGSCPFGPWLVTLDELEDPNKLDMKMYLNGELRQNSNTSATHYNMAELVSWWSHMTLEPGDVITTGSPPGVISGMKEPVWMKSGEVMECQVEGLGTLVTPVL